MPDTSPALPLPPDETPLLGVDPLPGVPTAIPAAQVGTAQVGAGMLADNPAITATINEVAKQLLAGIDATDDAIGKVIAGAAGDLGKARKAVGKEITNTIRAAEDELGRVQLDMQDQSIPVAWGAAERAAELSDPMGTAILGRISEAEAAVAPAGATWHGCSSGTGAIPAGVSAWAWDGGHWTFIPGNLGAMPTGPRPSIPGDVAGRWVSDPCALTASPPPPPVPEPAQGGGQLDPEPCELWAVTTDDQGVSTVTVPAELGAAVDHNRSMLAFDSSNGRGRWIVGAQRDFVPMPPGAERLDSTGPLPELPYASAAPCNPVIAAPVSPPPTSPPPSSPPSSPPSTPAPAGVCCPTPSINVTVPPAACPTAPPVTVIVPPPPPPPKTEPKPPQPIGTGPGEWTTPYMYWDDPKNCAAISERIYKDNLAAYPQDGDNDKPVWWTWVEGAGEAARWVIPGITTNLADLLKRTSQDSPEIAREISPRAVAAEQALSFFKDLPPGAVPEPIAARSLSLKLGMVGWVEQLTHVPFTYLFTSTRYALNFTNPQYIPGQPDVDRLYLTNRIDDGYWECLTRANGNLPRIHRAVRESKRTIPGVSEVVALRRRSLLSTDAAYLERMRELGVTDPLHAQEFYKLSEFIPPFTDLIRMMVRDSADDEVAAKYGYDEDFDAKYSAQLRKWAADQGISDDVARQLWRAHWRIPSPTQLYEMLHRLRPDRPAVREWQLAAEAHIDDPAWFAANPRPIIVTEADVRYALKVDDMAPNWIGPEIAVNYRPLTNTDARRAFIIGSMDRDELYHAMRDNGYSPENAERLTRFYEAEKSRSLAAATGVMSARKVLAAYREGLIDAIEAERLLIPAYPDIDTRRMAVQRAGIEREIEVRRVTVRAEVKRFVYGEIDLLTLSMALAAMGIVGAESHVIQAKAEANRNGHMKEIRIQYVLDLFRRGLINRNVAWDRMTRLGYSPEDIALMLEMAGALETEKQAARAARASDKARREAKAARQEALKNWEKYEADLKARIKEEEARLAALKGQECPAPPAGE